MYYRLPASPNRWGLVVGRRAEHPGHLWLHLRASSARGQAGAGLTGCGSMALGRQVTLSRVEGGKIAALPGQPGPFSLGGEGVLEAAYQRAGFHSVQIRVVPAPLRMSSAAECVRFERESFGALHQMMAGLSEAEREATWQEIAEELGQYENAAGFEGPCEMLIRVGVR